MFLCLSMSYVEWKEKERKYTCVDIIGTHYIPFRIFRIIRADIKFLTISTSLIQLKLHFFLPHFPTQLDKV